MITMVGPKSRWLSGRSTVQCWCYFTGTTGIFAKDQISQEKPSVARLLFLRPMSTDSSRCGRKGDEATMLPAVSASSCKGSCGRADLWGPSTKWQGARQDIDRSAAFPHRGLAARDGHPHPVVDGFVRADTMAQYAHLSTLSVSAETRY